MKALLLVLAVAGAAGATARHNRLVKAVPGVDSTVAASPQSIRLWFVEKPEVSVSSIKLADSAGTAITLGPARPTNEATSIEAAVPAPLARGAYVVTWKTSSGDGHVIRGKYTFRIAKQAPVD